jgi:hypothetical protein
MKFVFRSVDPDAQAFVSLQLVWQSRCRELIHRYIRIKNIDSSSPLGCNLRVISRSRINI